MANTPASLFATVFVPRNNWPYLIRHFGVYYDYHCAEGDAVTDLRGLLTEGVEGEFRSPGRYARMQVDVRELPRAPRAADWIELGDETYDVESVEGTLFHVARLIIKLAGQSWLRK